MKKLLIFCAVLMMFAVSAVAQAATVNVSLEPSTKPVLVGDTFDLDLYLRSSDGSPIVMSSIELLLEWNPTYVSFAGSASTVNGDYDWTTAMSMMPYSSNFVPMYTWEGSAGKNATYDDGDAWIQLTDTFTWTTGMPNPQTDLKALTLTFTALDNIDSTTITAGLGANSGVPPTTGDSYYIVEDGTGVYIGGEVFGAAITIAAIAVDIDIKFCSNPNAFNCKSRGKTPVTIFGTADLDVADINISTLRLCIAGTCVQSAPLDWSVADRGDPTTDLGAEQCAIEDDVEQDYLNPDGYDDLDVAFDSQQIATLIDCSYLYKNDVSDTLYITGELNDGTPIISVPVNDVGIDQLMKKNK